MRQFLLFILTFFSLNVYAQTVRLATYQYARNDRVKNIMPLAKQLENETGCIVEVKSYPDIPAFISAIQKNEVDIALISTFGYFLLDASSHKHPMEPKLALEVPSNAKDNYKTALLCRQESSLHEMQDVKAKAATLRALLVAPGSTSGNLVPRLALNGVGIADMEKEFLSVKYGQTHAGGIQLLLKDSADIAAMGYTEYEKLLQNDSVTAKKLRLVWLSPEIPLGPVLFNKDLSPELTLRIINTMLGLQNGHAETLQAVKNGWSEAKQATHYIPVMPVFYEKFKTTLGDKKSLENILQKFAN